MLNRVTILGRLVDDPTFRETHTTGVSVANFSLAVERDFTNQNTGKRDTDFFRVTAWRGLAEFVAKHFHKGDKAIVDGRLELSPWTLEDGTTRQTVIVVADNIYFGGSKRAVATEPVGEPETEAVGEKDADTPEAGLPEGADAT